ncbi:MAG: beta-glucosidase BglX [Clostridia bacterium]|nr:beta-glucosidase BglX [Clostridia bacterium]MBO5440756.1 beta-glucosidase BglX [Clostridia bacterium]
MSQRTKEILAKLTLDEKIYHLEQVTTATFVPSLKKPNVVTGPDSALKLDENLVFEVGTSLNLIGAETMIEAHDYYLKNSKNKIPPVFMQDVIHGHRTLYPINLAVAASFNRELAKELAGMAAKEASLDGVSVTFAPMVDLVRDPRWGRVMESSGEDPYLNGEMAKATVQGYQGDMGKYNIAACVKHFAAYGAAEAGRDYNTVDVSERTLREYYLPAYKSAVDAGVKMVMTAFNIVDGVPCVGNKHLVKDILRDEWGFDGVVISDYSAVEEQIVHGAAEDRKEAAYLAMEATLDIEMMSSCYAKHLKELMAEGKITEEQIDKAVLRILDLKEELGALDNSYRTVNPEEAKKIQLSKEHRALARKGAEESAVLLKNDGILPLSKDVGSVALIGPNANTGAIHGSWQCGGKIDETVTVYEGLRNILGDKVKYAPGCYIEYNSEDTSLIDEACSLAENCDCVVLCLGEHQDYSGEGNCRANIDLPEVQYKLLDRILEVNKNVAVVLFTGRPLAIERLDKTAPAILNMWMPGTEGGNASANLLFGNVVPSGKITMTFPRVLGQCPIYYNHYTTGRPKLPEDDYNRVRFTSSYLDIPNSPLYPFGYGLSYTSFEYSDLTLSGETMKAGDKLIASAKIKNTGKYKAKEAVQLYIRDVKGSCVRPVKELKGFEKIELDVGEERTVSFEINEEMLKYWNKELKFVAEKGEFEVFIGKDSNCQAFAKFNLI